MRAVLLFGTTLCLLLTGCDSSSTEPGKDASTEVSVTDLSSAPEAAGMDAAGTDGSSEAGTGDAAPAGCSAQCHGSASSTAPPLSVNGLSATTERAVGAHQAHLKSSTWHVPVQCGDCHLVPQQVTDTGHIDTALPAEVTFSTAAKADSASPAWGGTTCTGVYCHGATLNGGTATSPNWTKVDGSQAQCGACHGLPPGGGHTTSTSCSTCHGAVVDASMKIIAPNLHIDGKVSTTGGGHSTGYDSGLVHGPDFHKDPSSCQACHGTDYTGGAGKSCESCHPGWKTKCTFCHGGTDNTSGAPPEAVDGQTATTLRGVGAHTAHLKATSNHLAFACSTCHKVPTDALTPGHVDPSPAEVTFTGLAKADSANPTWTANLTCSGSYCHGATLSGGTLTTPKWTTVDGTQGKCGTCHGLPPTQNHSSSTACSTCHGAVVDASMKIIAPNLHVDGKVTATSSHPTGYNAGAVHGPDFNTQGPSACTSCHGSTLTGGAGTSCDSCHPGWKTDCTFCHGGTDNTTGAPPEAVDGKTATSVPGVGRHTSHVTAGTTHAAYGCALCHTMPQSALSPGHVDPGPAEVTFSGVAAGSSYNFSTYWCSNVYCHGNGKSGSGGSALWVGSLTGGCSACHDDETDGSNMALSGEHKKHVIDKNYNCNICHNCVVNGAKAITDPTKHINGSRDVCGNNLNWNATSKSCNPACHGSETW